VSQLAPMRARTTERWRPLRIAMVGQKGLPATYGGIEHHVEEIGRRLVDRGHSVTVYSRKSYGELPDGPYLGMDVRGAPTIASKHLDAIVHSFASTVLAMAHSCDIVHYHAIGPGLVAPLPRFVSKSGVVLTVHGLDQERDKWGTAAQSILGLAHWMSARVPDETIVVSRSLREHYRKTFGSSVSYIPNGADKPATASVDSLTEFGLEPQRYVLFVGRMVPEKAPDALLEAYLGVPGDYKLVLAGDSSFTDSYTAELRRLAERDPRVVLTGFVGGERLQALYQHARVFVLPSLVEGLPLTLLEAIGHAVPVVASDIDPHREILGESGRGHEMFRAGDLESLRRVLEHTLSADLLAPDVLRRFRDRVLESYSWEHASEQLEQVYLRVARRTRGVYSSVSRARQLTMGGSQASS
jgi:glycosyltransferase involved in cell wall biosynthesis